MAKVSSAVTKPPNMVIRLVLELYTAVCSNLGAGNFVNGPRSVQLGVPPNPFASVRTQVSANIIGAFLPLLPPKMVIRLSGTPPAARTDHTAIYD